MALENKRLASILTTRTKYHFLLLQQSAHFHAYAVLFTLSVHLPKIYTHHPMELSPRPFNEGKCVLARPGLASPPAVSERTRALYFR